jgi:hypothetical protein
VSSGRGRPVCGDRASARSLGGAAVVRDSPPLATGRVLGSETQRGIGPVVSALDLVVLDLVGRHPFLSVDNAGCRSRSRRELDAQEAGSPGVTRPDAPRTG